MNQSLSVTLSFDLTRPFANLARKKGFLTALNVQARQLITAFALHLNP
jgi:hypothetical protein